jgi:hypothetical protein
MSRKWQLGQACRPFETDAPVGISTENQFKAVNRESYVPELDARGLSKSALTSRRKTLSLFRQLYLPSQHPRPQQRLIVMRLDPLAIAGDAVRDACRRCFRITRRPWRNAGADREMVLMRWGMLPWSQSHRIAICRPPPSVLVRTQQWRLCTRRQLGTACACRC